VRYRTVYFGTPEFAVPTLSALHETSDIVGVVSQPDRPQGRGLQLGSPAVVRRARELGLEVFQPSRVRDGALERWLREREPEIAVVAAYGRILPSGVLAAPRRGCINLHASLLPAHRGSAPIQWALLRGERETGISLMQMDEGMDTGPVFLERALPIGAETNMGELTEALAALAADVLREHLLDVIEGRLAAAPPSSSGSTGPRPPSACTTRCAPSRRSPARTRSRAASVSRSSSRAWTSAPALPRRCSPSTASGCSLVVARARSRSCALSSRGAKRRTLASCSTVEP
jgi:methionyl-tRNA formyltransferase